MVSLLNPVTLLLERVRPIEYCALGIWLENELGVSWSRSHVSVIASATPQDSISERYKKERTATSLVKQISQGWTDHVPAIHGVILNKKNNRFQFIVAKSIIHVSYGDFHDASQLIDNLAQKPLLMMD
jgi:hypothetical protein